MLGRPAPPPNLLHKARHTIHPRTYIHRGSSLVRCGVADEEHSQPVGQQQVPVCVCARRPPAAWAARVSALPGPSFRPQKPTALGSPPATNITVPVLHVIVCRLKKLDCLTAVRYWRHWDRAE